MSRLAALGECRRLAASLGLGAALPPGLDGVPAEELKRLREAVDERLFDIDAARMRRIARLAGWLPAPLTARLARHWLGPWLTARVASEMPAHRAARVAANLPPEFLAAVAVELDPRCARDLLRQLPEGLIVEVARFLLERGEYLALGRFVEFVPDAAVRAVIAATPDEAELLQVAFHVGSKNRLDHLVRMLPEDRRRAVILLALDPQRDILLELLALVVHVSYALQRELGDLAAAQDDAVLDRIIRATDAHGLWPDLLPVVAALSRPHQQRVVNLPALHESPAMLGHILTQADAQGLWSSLLPLVGLMDRPMCRSLARAAEGLDRRALLRVADAAQMTERWEELSRIVVEMGARGRRRVVRAVFDYAAPDPELAERLLRLAERTGLDGALTPRQRQSLQAGPATG